MTAAHTDDTADRPGVIRLLSPSDLDAILALQHRVRSSLPDPTLLADDPPEFFARHLVAPNRIGGIDRDGRLVAFGVLGLDVPKSENFGAILGLPDARLAGVAQLDGAVVDRTYQSTGLHARLVRWRIAQAVASDCRDVLSTAAPKNVASWRTMVRLGLHAVALRYLFGGLPRLLLHRDLAVPRIPDSGKAEICPLEPELLAAQFAAGRIGIAPAPQGIVMARCAKES